MRETARLIGINCVVLLGILYVLNTLSALALDLQFQLESLVLGADERAELPVYADRAQAAVIYDEFQQLRTEYAPYVAWTREPFAGAATTIGADGDRVHPHTTEDPQQIVRFFGGSTTWGTGVGDRGTMPALFDARFPEVTAYNHGESAFMSRQDLARLINLVNRGEKMDWVVFYGGYNDAQYRCQSVTRNGHVRELRLAALVRPGSELVDSLIGPLREVVEFVWAALRKPSRPASPCEADPEYVEGVAGALIANWRLARAVAREGGAEFVAILQPMAAYGAPLVDHLTIEHKKVVGMINAYDAMRAAVRHENLPWMIDMTEIFDNEPEIYVDYCHVGERGNEMLSRAIARVLIEEHRARL